MTTLHEAAMRQALEWIEATKDDVLQPLSNSVQGGIGATAEGLGGCSVKVLKDLRSALAQQGEHKPNCKECAKWSKEQADNREWIEGVAKGRRIVEKLAAKELQCRNS